MSKKPTRAETIARLKSMIDQANGRIMARSPDGQRGTE